MKPFVLSGILRGAGCEVKSSDFLRIVIPFTLCAVTVGFLFRWLARFLK